MVEEMEPLTYRNKAMEEEATIAIEKPKEMTLRDFVEENSTLVTYIMEFMGIPPDYDPIPEPSPDITVPASHLKYMIKSMKETNSRLKEVFDHLKENL